MLMRFLIRCGHYQHGDKLVRVKSWLPSYDGHWLGWPTLIVDRWFGERETSTPCWLRVPLRRRETLKIHAEELDLLRQWYNSLRDTHPESLEAKDHALGKRITEECGYTFRSP